MLYDARDGSIYEHRHLSLDTVFGGEACKSVRAVLAFAQRMKFPEHALVVRSEEKWRAGVRQEKGIQDEQRLTDVAEGIIAEHSSVWVETDMRAMANPTRMNVIGETAERFAQELVTRCSACSACWFRITEALSGLPCALCGWLTRGIRAYRRSCRLCGHQADLPRPDAKIVEEPQFCDQCNP